MKIIINILIIFFLTTNIIYSNENAQFLSLKNNKVNVRYGPGLDYPIKYIYKKKFFPVKVIDKKGNFRRIIDHKKNSGWIHKIMLIKSKSLITTSEKILFKKDPKSGCNKSISKQYFQILNKGASGINCVSIKIGT